MMRPHGPNCWNGDGAFKLRVRLEVVKKSHELITKSSLLGDMTAVNRMFFFSYFCVFRLGHNNNNLGTRPTTLDVDASCDDDCVE
jgi:hypothetical protein